MHIYTYLSHLKIRMKIYCNKKLKIPIKTIIRREVSTEIAIKFLTSKYKKKHFSRQNPFYFILTWGIWVNKCQYCPWLSAPFFHPTDIPRYLVPKVSKAGPCLGSIWVWDNSRVSMNWGFDDTLKKIGVRDLENHESSTMFERQEAWFLMLSYPISFTVLFSSWRQNFVLLVWV